MAGELDRLIIRLEADTALLRRAMSDAEKGVDSLAGKVDKSMSRVEKATMQAGASFQAAFAKPLAALAAAASLASINALIDTVDKLDNSARAAGLTTERYQQLRSALAELGLEHGKFDSVIVKFSSQMGELRARTGGFHDFLQQHLPTLGQQLIATKTQSEAVTRLLDGVSQLSNVEDRAIIIKQALGEEATVLAGSLTKQGAALKAAEERARSFTETIDKHAIENIKRLKTALDSLGDTLTARVANGFGAAAGKAAGFFESVGEWLSKSKKLNNAMDEVLKRRGAGLTGQDAMAPLNAVLSGWDAVIDRAEAAGAATDRVISLKPKIPPFQTSLDFSGVDALAGLEKQRAGANKDTFGQIALEYQADLERFRRLLEDKKINEDEYQQARVALQEIAGGKIAEARKREEEEWRSHFAELESLITNQFMGALDEAFRTGELNAKKFFSEMLIGMAKMVVQAQILKPIMDSVFNSSGPLAGGLGSLLGVKLPGMAGGGPVSAGAPHIVGERGPELFVPNTAGRIVPNSRMGGSGGSVVYNIDASRSDIGAADRIMQGLQEAQRLQPSPVSYSAGYRRRFPTRG